MVERTCSEAFNQTAVDLAWKAFGPAAAILIVVSSTFVNLVSIKDGVAQQGELRSCHRS